MLLERIHASAARRSLPLVILIQPFPANLDGTVMELQALQFEFAREIAQTAPPGCPTWVDGIASLRGLAAERSQAELFFDHVHPRPLLNRVLARTVAERLEPWIRSRL